MTMTFGRFAAMAGICTVVLAACSSSNSPPPAVDPDTGQRTSATFAKSYGDVLNNSAKYVIPMPDGAYAFAGDWAGIVGTSFETVDPGVHLGREAWVGMLDPAGDVVWQVLLGEGAVNSDAELETRRSPMRRTADGGYVVGGSRLTQTTGADFLVEKITAAGEVEWSRSYDSGSWRDYTYVANTSTEVSQADDPDTWAPAAAADTVIDVVTRPDGGYWVVGKSTATLGTPIPFGAGDDEYSVAGGTVVRGAMSTVVLLLDAAGNLLGQHRYTEDQFDDGGGEPIIYTATDGSAVLVRTISAGNELTEGDRIRHDVLLVDRIGADIGSSGWQPLARARYELSGEQGSLRTPRQVIQTDDPELGGPRDGVRDDGFAILLAQRGSASRLFKLDRNLGIQWHYSSPDPFQTHEALVQACPPFPEDVSQTECIFVLGGYGYDGLGQPAFSVIESVDARIGLRRLRSARLSALQTIDAIEDRPSNSGHFLELVGQHPTDPNRGRLFRVVAPTFAPRPVGTIEFPRTLPGRAPLGRAFMGHFSADRGWVMSYMLSSIYSAFSADGTPDGDFRARTRRPQSSTTARGIVSVGRTSVIVAAQLERPGEERSPERRLLLARINSGTSVWQRVYDMPFGDVGGMVGADDGGVVLFVSSNVQTDGINRLIKFNGAGEIVWESAPITATVEDTSYDRSASFSFEKPYANGSTRDRLVRLADGGYAALGSNGAVARLDRDGGILWQRNYHSTNWGPYYAGLVIEAFAAIEGADARDSGFILMSPYVATLDTSMRSRFMRIIRTDAEGAIVWQRVYEPGRYVRLRPRRVQPTRDGGFIVAADQGWEAIESTQQSRDLAGSTNVAVLKFDASGAPVWDHVYGGLHGEYVRGLNILADGGMVLALGSDSMGDAREAWILRLGPDGLLAQGCNAQLGTLSGGATPFIVAQQDEAPIFDTIDLARPFDAGLVRTSTERFIPLETPPIVTARQCAGNANPAAPFQPARRFRVTVEQSGSTVGLVTSAPQGIDCGPDGGSDQCSADFAEGSQVRLTADDTRLTFFGWNADCEPGAAENVCIVTVTGDLTVQAVFEPVTTRMSLAFVVNGPGTVYDGLDGDFYCREGSSAQVCQQGYSSVTEPLFYAEADAGAQFQGWGGDCALFGQDSPIELTTASNAACTATFTGDAPARHPVLTVTLIDATSEDRVISRPFGIDCNSRNDDGLCSARFAPGEQVTLLSNAARPAWGLGSDPADGDFGDCDEALADEEGRIGECIVTMTEDRTVLHAVEADE